ncbi:MAG: hypothetical protein COB53_11725 [Elusimicrobia bacterium]|nr:MAG: hypothetical protein COB53_11725 [Elusimicrobiota bacterium]
MVRKYLVILPLLFWGPAVQAADIPDEWRCNEKRINRFWEGLKHIDPKKGPAWGEELHEKLPTPFAWLVLYKNRDRDIAERRAPLNRRWTEFSVAEKCAYLRQYFPETIEKKKEFDELVGWKEDGKLSKRLTKLVDDKEDLVAAQESLLLKEWRTRFAGTLDWLEVYGLEDEEGTRERARGIFIRISRLKSAYLAFQQESGWFESRVRLRLDDALADADLKSRIPRSVKGMLVRPEVQTRVIHDIAEQLSKDWRNERILGDQFEFRLVSVLRLMKREKKASVHTAKVKEVRRVITQKKLSRKKAERLVDGIEKDLKKENIVFPGGADAQLLISLEEYRRGRKKLYPMAEGGQPRENLVKSYLQLLKDVCVTHYTSIRYKKRVIKTLCGQ